MKPCYLANMVLARVFYSRAGARSRKQMVAQESKKDCCETGSPEDECKQKLHGSKWNRNIAQPDWKQTAEAIGRNSRSGVRGKHMFGHGRK